MLTSIPSSLTGDMVAGPFYAWKTKARRRGGTCPQAPGASEARVAAPGAAFHLFWCLVRVRSEWLTMPWGTQALAGSWGPSGWVGRTVGAQQGTGLERGLSWRDPQPLAMEGRER